MIASEPTTQQTAERIQAEDPQNDDDASSIGGYSSNDSLASLRSSILDYRIENGRTYHKMSDGKYAFPNDEREKDRLDVNHHLWTLTWDNDLCLSPKKDGAKRVLDIGTGTGIWALEYADEHPDATVLGVDLSPIQPGFIPPNCSFEVDDVEKEWTWSTPFDFIFIRNMIASFSSWEDIIRKAYENLEPGGILELQDNTFELKCDDGTMPDDWKPLKWTKLIIEGTDKMGRSVTVPSRFEQLLKDAGFVDVEVRKTKWPLNPWPKDKKAKELGTWAEHSFMIGIESVSMGLFTRVLDWSAAETTVFCAEVRNECRKIGPHAYLDVYAAWGRKPEKEGSEAPQV